jgi:hypothetical protein
MKEDIVKHDLKDETKRWWTESLGRIEIQMTLEQAEMVPLSGQCEHGTCLLAKEKDVMAQLDKYTPELIAECLNEYGCWSLEDLKDHEANILRLLWMAASDIQEQEDDEDEE